MFIKINMLSPSIRFILHQKFMMEKLYQFLIPAFSMSTSLAIIHESGSGKCSMSVSVTANIPVWSHDLVQAD